MHCSRVQGKVHVLVSCAAMQKRLTAVFCHCINTTQDLLLLQVCKHQTPMHCSRVQGKMLALVVCAAVHNKLTAALCHCIYTSQDLLFIQGCNHQTPMHCITVQGKLHALLLRVAVPKQVDSSLVTLQTHPSRFAIHTGCVSTKQQCTAALFRAKCMPTNMTSLDTFTLPFSRSNL